MRRPMFIFGVPLCRAVFHRLEMIPRHAVEPVSRRSTERITAPAVAPGRANAACSDMLAMHLVKCGVSQDCIRRRNFVKTRPTSLTDRRSELLVYVG
jgi:hypothetical protein